VTYNLAFDLRDPDPDPMPNVFVEEAINALRTEQEAFYSRSGLDGAGNWPCDYTPRGSLPFVPGHSDFCKLFRIQCPVSHSGTTVDVCKPDLNSQRGQEPFVARAIRDQEYEGEPLWVNVLAVWVLPQMQNWVYVAVVADTSDPYPVLVELACRTVKAPLIVNHTVAWHALDAEFKYGTIVRVCGDEFSDSFQSLVCPPVFTTELDAFPVGNWVTIARMGSYFGDVGCVIAHDFGVIFVATQMRMHSEAQELDATYAPLLLRMPHIGFGDVAVLMDENKEELEIGGIACIRERHGLERTFTMSGMRVMGYHPWELRIDRADGFPLTVIDQQAQFFQQGLPSERVESMPPVKDSPYPYEFISAERVRLDCKTGLLMKKLVMLDVDTLAWEVYHTDDNMNMKACWTVPEKRLKKEHTFEQAFHPLLAENVDLLSCDYFRGEAKIQQRNETSETGNPVASGVIYSASYWS
jgi:hypothetical protein